MTPNDKYEMLFLQIYYTVFRNIRVNFAPDQCYHLRSSASRQKGKSLLFWLIALTPGLKFFKSHLVLLLRQFYTGT